MIVNPILKEKYETQKRLDAEAEHSLKRYFENSHRNVEKIAGQFGLQFQYGEAQGGTISATVEESQSTG